MRFDNIETMPIHHDTIVTHDMVDSIIKYNGNDVDATAEFFKRVKFETDLRIKLSDEYDLNLMNASEPKLAREIFGKFLSEEMGIPYRELKERRTYRNRIYARELVFDYVKFDDPILQGCKDFYMKLEFNPYNFAENNIGLKKVNKTFRYHNVPEVVIGLGGIHGCVNAGVYEARKDLIIHDLDVKSYYPNLGIKNGLFPEHLSLTFCTTYAKLYKMRTEIPKASPINYIFKIILNSTYGLSKEMNNYLHDPNYTFAITINGQLLILMLAEFVRKRVKDVFFYQLNTDGITIGYHPKHAKAVAEAMKEWEKLTNLELEDKYYTKMVINNVNNYMAVDTKGVVKRKGSYFAYSLDPEDKELDYHKNPSMLIVPKALEAYFIHGKPYEEFIRSSTDILDFCLGVKLKKDFELERQWYDKAENKISRELINQTVVRYYVSKESSTIKKKYKAGTKKAGQTVELEAGWNLTYYNSHTPKPIKEYNIDYSYYISKVRDIINQITPHARNLQLAFPEAA
jgi:hypothetical protein